VKKYLITGITGTMGQALSKLILNKIPNAFILGISRDEQKQRLLPKHERITYKLADIRDKQSLFRAIGNESVIDCVFHLAALKCVDTLEDNVFEAVQTNVVGTQNIVDIAQDYGSDLVLASTDKACYPVNAYGATKALAERIVTSADFKVCRYGNVIGSRGSFVPTIVECLKKGIPIPITDKEMTRFWLKTEDVASFLMDVSEDAVSGEVLIPKDIFSCHVTILVKAIAEILGVENYDYRIVGIRPGEKIHETLQTVEEGGLFTSQYATCTYSHIVEYLRSIV
jgi:UDP-N-acetylglucosamine 4,6-dehydratase